MNVKKHKSPTLNMIHTLQTESFTDEASERHTVGDFYNPDFVSCLLHVNIPYSSFSRVMF